MNIWLDDCESIRVVCGVTIAYTREAYEAALEEQRQLILNTPRRSALMSNWNNESRD